MRILSVLGCTGSIGTQTLQVAEELGCSVAALAAYSDVSTVDAKKRAVDFDDVRASEAESFARWLSGMRVSELESGGELVNSVTFFDMHGVQSLSEFSVQDRWRKNRTYENIKPAEKNTFVVERKGRILL